MNFLDLECDIFNVIIQFMPTKILQRKAYFGIIVISTKFQMLVRRNNGNIREKYRELLSIHPFTPTSRVKHYFAINAPSGRILSEYFDEINSLPSYQNPNYRHNVIVNLSEYITLNVDGRNMMEANVALLESTLNFIQKNVKNHNIILCKDVKERLQVYNDKISLKNKQPSF